MTTAKAHMPFSRNRGKIEERQQTITEVDDQCSAPDYDSLALPTASVGSVVATQSTAGTGEGISMSDRPFFKIWAAKALLSDDLDSLSDHERTIWLFALCVASLETPRWRVRITANLARKCKTTNAKLAATLNKLADLGMCELQDGEVYFATAAKLNEDTEKRKPSDDPERVRQRVQRHRDSKKETPDETPGNADDVTLVTRYSNAHKEEEKEEEEEVGGVTAPAQKRPPRPAFSDEDRAALVGEFGSQMADVGERIDLALSHKNAAKYTNLRLYVRNWLKRDLDDLRQKGIVPIGKAKSLDDPFAAMVVKGYDQ